MTGWPIHLGEGVWQFQTPLWQTNALLAVADGEALLCDPNWEPAEIEAIRREATGRAGGAVHLLVTHGDYDHTCGIGLFPEATVIAGADTAERIRSGVAAEELAAAGAEWGLAWPGELRVDRVVEAGTTFEAGPFSVAAIDARGHVADGLAYVLLEQGVLLPGDYLSAMTYPFALDSLTRLRQTNERLLAALDEHELRWIVPGHGPALAPEEARRIGEEDLGYLDRLAEAAGEARTEGLSAGHALVAVYERVEPPRPTTPDFEFFALRTVNAKAALAEASP